MKAIKTVKDKCPWPSVRSWKSPEKALCTKLFVHCGPENLISALLFVLWHELDVVNIYRRRERGIHSFISVVWEQNYFIVLSCKQNSLHKSNILLLSNNIPLLSLNLLSSHWGSWWCVLCCGIRRGFRWIICSPVVYCITESLWRETFEEGY